MSGFLKFAIGVAVLGFVGLIGLSVMSTIATLVFSHSESHQVVADLPAHVQVNVHDSGLDSVGSFAGSILFLGILAIVFIVILSMRRSRVIAPSDETALVHELARRAQDLSQRMEALETILLDRTRATR